jgi:hypothetical protein
MNPITGNDPWAKAAGSALQFFTNGFSGPTRDEQRLIDAKIALQQAQESKARAEALGQEMRNAAPGNAQGIFGRMMLEMDDPAEQPRPAPSMIGPMPAETPDMIRDKYAPEFFRSAMEYSSDSPGQLGGVFRAFMGAQPGDAYSQTAMDRAMMGAGDPYSDTMGGFREKEANDLASAADVAGINNAGAMARLKATPLTETQARGAAFQNLPTRSQAAAVGPTATEAQGTLGLENFDNLADLDPSQQKYLGAQPDGPGSVTPRNWQNATTGQTGITIDGVTDAITKQPLPPGSNVFTGQLQGDSAATGLGLTNRTVSELENADMAMAELGTILESTKEFARKAGPTAFGLTGDVRRAIQGVVGQVDAVKGALGLGVTGNSLAEGIASMEARAAAEGRRVDPNVIRSLQGLYDPNMDSLDRLSILLAFKAAAALGKQDGRGLSDRDYSTFRDLVGDPTEFLMSQDKFINGLDLVGATANAMARDRNVAMGRTGSQPAQQNGPPRITSDAEYDALAPGTQYIGPDGQTRVKQ